MSETVLKCAQCGALPKRREARHCEYCGTELPRTEGQALSPDQLLQARFHLLEQHALLPELLRRAPSTTGTGLGLAGMVVFGGIFTAMAVAMTTMTGTVFGPVALFPMFFILVGIGITLKGATSAARFAKAPLQRERVLIVDERTQVSGGGRNSRSTTRYFATVQDPDGERHEYEIAATISGKIAAGDVGIAYLKGEFMIDFQRVPV